MTEHSLLSHFNLLDTQWYLQMSMFYSMFDRHMKQKEKQVIRLLSTDNDLLGIPI